MSHFLPYISTLYTSQEAVGNRVIQEVDFKYKLNHERGDSFAKDDFTLQVGQQYVTS